MSDRRKKQKKEAGPQETAGSRVLPRSHPQASPGEQAEMQSEVGAMIAQLKQNPRQQLAAATVFSQRKH